MVLIAHSLAIGNICRLVFVQQDGGHVYWQQFRLTGPTFLAGFINEYPERGVRGYKRPYSSTIPAVVVVCRDKSFTEGDSAEAAAARIRSSQTSDCS